LEDKEILKTIPWLNNTEKQRNTPNSKSQYIPKRSTCGTKKISTPSPSYLQESPPPPPKKDVSKSPNLNLSDFENSYVPHELGRPT